MQINQRIVGDVAVVEVIGDLVAYSGDVMLRDKVRSLRQQGYAQLVIDLGQVGYMDSMGLGELIHAYATTTKSGGTLKLMRVTKRLRDLLAITKLVTVFETVRRRGVSPREFLGCGLMECTAGLPQLGLLSFRSSRKRRISSTTLMCSSVAASVSLVARTASTAASRA